jgi:hypothetical protein
MNPKHEKLTDEMGRQLTAYLLKQTGWVTTHGMRVDLGFSRRDCKMARVAAGADNVISTNAGYRATELATDEELQDARDMMHAQAIAAWCSMQGIDGVIAARVDKGKRALVEAIHSGTVDDWHKALKEAGLIT